MIADSIPTADDHDRAVSLPVSGETSECVTGANGRCTCPMPAYRLMDQPCVIAAIAAGTVALLIALVVLMVVTP